MIPYKKFFNDMRYFRVTEYIMLDTLQEIMFIRKVSHLENIFIIVKSLRLRISVPRCIM